MATAAVGEQMGCSDLLGVVAVAQRIVRDAEIDLLTAVVDFCASHPPVDGADRCRVRVPGGGVEGRDVLAPLGGEGVPEVSAVAVARLGATLGMSPGSVQRLVGEAMELGYRLPGVYERVQAGRVLVWQARRVARATCGLSREAARFVDRQLYGLAGQIGVGSLDRLVAEAVARHDRARAGELARQRSDRRGFAVELGQCDLLGQVPVHGVLDLPDALALQAAVGHRAEQLCASGSTDARQVRRARAVGDLAREHLAGSGQVPPTQALWDDEQRTLTPVPGGGEGAASGEVPVGSVRKGCAPGGDAASAHHRPGAA